MAIIKITIILGKHLDRWLLAFLLLIYRASPKIFSQIFFENEKQGIVGFPDALLRGKRCTQMSKEGNVPLSQKAKFVLL